MKKENRDTQTSRGWFFSLLKKYYKQNLGFVIGMLLLVFFSTIIRVIQPKLIEQLLTSIIQEGDWWIWVIVMTIVLILIGVLTFFSNWIGGKLGKKIEIEVRKDTLNNLVKQDMSFYSDKKSGEILTKLISDTAVIGDQSQRIPTQLLSALFTMIGSAIILFTIDVNLTLITLGLTILIMIVVVFSFSLLRKRMMRVREVMTEINGDVSEKITSISLIKASGTEQKERNMFERIHRRYYESNNKANNATALMITLMTAGIMSISTIVIISAALLYNGPGPNGMQKLLIVLPSFLSGVTLMISPILQMAQLSSGFAQASNCSERIIKLNESKTRIDVLNSDNKTIIDSLKGDIVFEDVVFSYPEKPENIILPKTSFVFKAGKSYAFVGETGVGKSTISKLLLRFYDPLSGDIFINGDLNLKDVYLPSYLSKVGYVEQDPQILYGTVKDNVAYGLDDITDQMVIEACKKAKLDKVIESWPEKYETILGERGFSLSGGQKQRLVIARMFLKNPSLLILDEATSALDNIVESEIGEELKNLSKGRTTVTIAHRLSTIKDVDQIIVLKKDHGIIEQGTFEELISKSGYFRDLYNAGLMK